MPLTPAQLLTLKAFILADPILNAFPNTSDGNFALTQELNKPAVPPFIVWRESISANELIKAMVWTEFIARQPGERDAWMFLTAQGTINAGDPNVRQGIQDMFSGPGGVQTRTNLIAVAKRAATVAEKLFATGVGTDASPGTLVVVGNLTQQDVETARNLP
jgi:hypothetical protein